VAVQAQPLYHDAAAPRHPLLLRHHRNRRHLQQQPCRPRSHQKRKGKYSIIWPLLYGPSVA
jgi:hypothetical protein